jgi:hypothetical protein
MKGSKQGCNIILGNINCFGDLLQISYNKLMEHNKTFPGNQSGILCKENTEAKP